MLNVMNTFLCVPVIEYNICSIQYYHYILYAVCITGVAFGRDALRIQIFMTTEGCPRQAHLLEANGIWMAY